MYRLAVGLALLVLTQGFVAARAQDSSQTPRDSTRAWYEDSWTSIITRKGVQFHYIFYEKADSKNNGVVIRLRNQNEYPVRYEFTVLFRAPDAEAKAEARGRLAPLEVKTGEGDGLFWIPFRDGRRIGQVGLRGITIERADRADPPDLGLRLHGKRPVTKLYKSSVRRT